ncbi:hypothetical protein IGI04_036299, partial [Brassica rapa subsp. trilocularis]
ANQICYSSYQRIDPDICTYTKKSYFNNQEEISNQTIWFRKLWNLQTKDSPTHVTVNCKYQPIKVAVVCPKTNLYNSRCVSYISNKLKTRVNVHRILKLLPIPQNQSN